jgi:hypothetical protein
VTTGSTPTRTYVRAQDVHLRGKAAREARGLEATMAQHKAGYVKYQAARAKGTNRERYRPAYTAYKRAYAQLLALRRAAAEVHQ